jgi:hypothetical protein
MITERECAAQITVCAWHLPVTESLRSRHNEAVTMSNVQEFDLWGLLVSPNLMPLFFGLTIARELIRKAGRPKPAHRFTPTLTLA